MATMFQIKKGLSANLSNVEVIEGCWYLTTDTGKLYVGINGQLMPINEAESFDPTDLQNDINDLDNRLTFIESIDAIGGGDSTESVLSVD